MFREDGQEYAQVTKMLGNGRLEAQCFDGEKRLAHIRGKMRKKVCSHRSQTKTELKNFSVTGLDKPGRYRTAIPARIPGWKSRRDRKIHSR